MSPVLRLVLGSPLLSILLLNQVPHLVPEHWLLVPSRVRLQAALLNSKRRLELNRTT